MSANSASFGSQPPSRTNDELGPLDEIQLGSMAEDTQTPVVLPSPIPNPYVEYSNHWVQAAQQGMTAGDIKNLVDSLYSQFQHGLDHMSTELKEGMRKRKTEARQLQKQIDELEEIRQRQAAQIAEAQSENRALREKLAHAEQAFKSMQVSLQNAEKAYAELQGKMYNGTSGLSQSLFPTMKEPDTFNGEKASKLDDWLESMALWLRHRGVTQDEKKVETAMTYLRGTAKKVMQAYFDKVNDQEPLGAYADFVAELKKGFQQTDKKDRAIAEFNQLVQKKGTNAQNFGEFSARFRTLAKQTGFSNADLLSKLYTHVPKPAADVLIARGRDKWAKTWEEFINQVQEILQDQRLLNGTVLTNQNAKDPNAMDVDAVKGKKSSDKTPGKQAKLRKMAMSFEEARRRGCCVKCGGKGHLGKDCPSGKDEQAASSSKFSKDTNSPSGSSSKTPSTSGKGKEKDTGKTKYTKKSIRELHGSDSERFEDLESDNDTESDSDKEAYKSKKKSSSREKTQKINRVVFSDDEDFLRGPM